MIKKTLTLLNCLVFLSLLIVASCSMDSASGNDTPVDETKILLSIRFEEDSEFASVASSAEAIVTADDMDTIVSELTIGKTTVSGEIKDVPAGKDRYIQANVYNDKKELCYKGRAVVDVEAGEEIIAAVNLYKVDETGTIIIEGVVIDNNNSEYFTEEELNALVKRMADAARADIEKVMTVLKAGKKFYETKWKKSQLAEVEKIIGAAIREVLGNNDEYYTERELIGMVERVANEEKKDVEDALRILREEGKLFGEKWKKTQEREVMEIIKVGVAKAKDATNDEYFTKDELNGLVVRLSEAAGVDARRVIEVLRRDGKFYTTRWKKEQEREVVALIEAAIKEISE